MGFMDYVKNWWLTGLIVGGLSYLISMLFNKLDIPVLNLTMTSVDVNVRQQLISGIPTTAGQKIFAFLSGYVNMQMPETVTILLPLLLSSVVFVILGRVVYDFLPKGKTIWQKLSLVLLYGTLIAVLVLGYMAGTLAFDKGLLAMVLTLGIYYAIIGVLLTQVYKWFDLKVPQ